MAELQALIFPDNMSDSKTPIADTSLRSVRSFVRREGRVTKAQQQAIELFWPRYGFSLEREAASSLDFTELFGREAPVVLEIGYGDGEALVDAAGREPGTNFIGAEVYTAGIGHCLLRIEQTELENVRLCSEDAVELLKHHIKDNSLTEIRLFFPDPWPKKKHHKRRIVNAVFCDLVCNKLVPGGRIHFATDWAPYSEWALDVFEACPCLENIAGPGKVVCRPDSRIETKFERRGQRLGQASQDLIYRRVGPVG